MAISIDEQYPGKTAGTSTEYPLGKARNVTVPGDGTGTPWEQAIVNDDQGFKQALLAAAEIDPSGTPDTAVASQYLEALYTLFPRFSASGLTETDANTGEIRFPVGDKTLRIKYGRSGFVGGDNTIQTQSFGSTFPTKCLLVIPYTVTNSTTGAGAQRMAQLIDFTTSSFRWFSDTFSEAPKAIACGFIAVGY